MTPADRSHAISAARTLLEGCAMEYGQAIDTNRLDAWAKMAHSIIELLAAKEPAAQKIAEGENL